MKCDKNKLVCFGIHSNFKLQTFHCVNKAKYFLSFSDFTTLMPSMVCHLLIN